MPLFSRLAPASLCLAALLDARTTLAQSRGRRAQPVIEQPPSPVTLNVEQQPRTLRWRFSLTNRGDRPVDVAVDRNMLSVEITAPAPVIDPAASPRARRRAPRAPKPARCRGALFHSNTDETARAQLAPGQNYSEGFDLRSLCGVRFPRALVAGSTLTFTYGARGRRPSFARAVVFQDGPAPIEELRAEPFALAGDAASFPPSATPSEGSEGGPVELRVPRAISADRVASLSFRASLRGTGSAPLRAFYRPSMLSLEVRTPRGRAFRCSDTPLGYVGLPDYLRTISRSSGPAATLSAGLLCDRSLFGEAGVYLVRVVFESNVETETARRPSFRGSAVSPWISALIRRGSPVERYVPLPEQDPFATPATAARAAEQRAR